MGIEHLSPPQCILLAASLASDSNIQALYKLTPTRLDVFDQEVLLRILLTCLPESLDPAQYIDYLHETTTRVYLKQQPEYTVDCSSVEKLSQDEAERQLKKLHLTQLYHPSIAEGTINDPLVIFLIHRAHKIELETGLLPNVPKLLEPFLDRSKYLREWFISAILPLVRMEYEYYPRNTGTVTSLHEFENYAGGKGVTTLLTRTLNSVRDGTASENSVGRDFRGIIGPWMYGSSQRKRRKLHDGLPPSPVPIGQTDEGWSKHQKEQPQNADVLENWQPVFRWVVDRAGNEFDVAVKVVEGWDGPSDVDLGGYQKGWRLDQKDDELKDELLHEYCQTAFATIYAAQDDNPEVLDGAHAVLVRLASLLNFEPPPDLATSIHLLPKVDVHSENLEEASAVEYLQSSALISSWNPLTHPKLETFSLLQMLVYSAYQLSSLNHKVSVATVAKIRFWSDSSEQLKVLTQILHKLEQGSRRTDDQWSHIRDVLLWLWDWAIEQEASKTGEGAGVFGKIRRYTFERKILETLCQTGLFSLIVKVYLEKRQGHESPLPEAEVEKVIVRLLLQYYDNASNGNRTRGGMKKASDLLAAFKKNFSNSINFRRCAALLAATHAMSFYSLALQHGVPFQPVSIRVSGDPVSLIAKILEQNPKSYTKLDDLIEIGKNLVIGKIDDDTLNDNNTDTQTIVAEASPQEEEEALQIATRRITGMAIDAALSEDDFETAYSYVVNRLTPTAPSTTTSPFSDTQVDDISWRAALAAGKYRVSSSSTSTSSSTPVTPTHTTHRSGTNPDEPPNLRRLSQRLDLLSHALLLAPPGPALPVILATWRRCEEELLAARQAEAEMDASHDSAADAQRGDMTGSGTLPGGFLAEEPGLSVQPVRKEMGRGEGEEAPMGLFEVARGAAAAISRSTSGAAGRAGSAGTASVSGGLALPISLKSLRNAAGGLGGVLPVPISQNRPQPQASSNVDEGGANMHTEHHEEARVRKRDMLAGAVTGGGNMLASGLGNGLSWVLGAPPMGAQQAREGEERGSGDWR